MLTRWLENEPGEALICAVTSAVALVLSLTGAVGNLLPFDIAWVAIILCGIPILTGAFKGVIFEHDIKADLLVSLALIASVATGEFCGGRSCAYHADRFPAGRLYFRKSAGKH